MKKFIAAVICFTMATALLSGCRNRENKKTTDTTTTPSTITTAPTTSNTVPTTHSTMPHSEETTPSESNSTQGNTNENQANGNDNGGADNRGDRSRAHYPSIVGGSR